MELAANKKAALEIALNAIHDATDNHNEAFELLALLVSSYVGTSIQGDEDIPLEKRPKFVAMSFDRIAQIMGAILPQTMSYVVSEPN